MVQFKYRFIILWLRFYGTLTLINLSPEICRLPMRKLIFFFFSILFLKVDFHVSQIINLTIFTGSNIRTNSSEARQLKKTYISSHQSVHRQSYIGASIHRSAPKLRSNVWSSSMLLLSYCITEARWHIGMLSASHREDPGSNLGKGLFFRLFSCRNGNENECRVLIKRKETT